MATKYIFVTGGVVSSLGKGLAASSIGRLLEARGFRVTLQKFDPYLNVDPGTMSPFQHGEVFVTDDGAETDLDLGHYERYVSTTATKDHNFTTGKIYESVITKERRGDYLGGTVQVIPHVTDEIKAAVRSISPGIDIQICEIGGTVGDIESLPFLEAIRQFRLEVGKSNSLFIHLTLVPHIAAAGELKTKPTQHSVRELRAIGIQPDILLCRCDRPLPQELKRKIALFCNVPVEAVVTAQDVGSIYQVPLMLGRESLDAIILKEMDLPYKDKNMDAWEAMVRTHMEPSGGDVHIAMVGKYVRYEDSYKSLNEALAHGGIANDVRVHLDWIEAEEIENGELQSQLAKADGVLVPGGFGIRGTAGMVRAIQFARENKVPFFGICLGLQCAVLDFARNVSGIKNADSSEFNEDAKEAVIYKLRDLLGVDELGGTMRLGSYPCRVTPGSFAHEAYGESEINERHRHRYEFNKHYFETLSDDGLLFTGMSPDRKFVEIVELKDHPWFLACQFHPEFKSRPLAPHPLFKRFIRAAVQQRDRRATAAQASSSSRGMEA